MLKDGFRGIMDIDGTCSNGICQKPQSQIQVAVALMSLRDLQFQQIAEAVTRPKRPWRDRTDVGV